MVLALEHGLFGVGQQPRHLIRRFSEEIRARPAGDDQGRDGDVPDEVLGDRSAAEVPITSKSWTMVGASAFILGSPLMPSTTSGGIPSRRGTT